MRCLNKNIGFLYGIIIFSFFINILGVINFIPMIKIIKPIMWFIIFVVAIFITINDYNKFYNVKEKAENIIIILLIYFIFYFSLGLLFGYSYNIYNNNNITSIIKNIYIYIIPIIFQEYVRSILCNYSNNNWKIKIIISITFILVNFNYSSLFNMFDNGESFLKFLSLNLIPTVCLEFVLTYLCSVGSYKLSVMYKILFTSYSIFLPIVPNLNFFIIGIVNMALPIIIYLIIDKYYEKEIQNIYLDNRKYKYLDFIPLVLAIIFVICNNFGVFRYQIITVLSNSMNPIYYKGDAILIKKLTEEEKEKLKIGDIISFNDKNGNLIIHRIDGVIKNENKPVFITKGDNNTNSDVERVELKNIKGKYTLKIKYLGYFKSIIYDILND